MFESFGIQRFVTRWLAAMFLVLATYNPSGYSYYHWVSELDIGQLIHEFGSFGERAILIAQDTPIWFVQSRLVSQSVRQSTSRQRSGAACSRSTRASANGSSISVHSGGRRR